MKKKSYKDFDNEKKFLHLENSVSTVSHAAPVRGKLTKF